MEQISFTFNFDSAWSLTPPVIEIINNDIQICSPTEIKGPTQLILPIDLETTQSNGCLKIIRSNHDEVTDQTCQLVSLIADDIDLQKILNHTKFYPIYPRPWYDEQVSQGKNWPEFHCGWTTWGWNGTWMLEYSTPFYDWLLKKL